MPFSFADLGFWRTAAIAFAFELAHAILQGHWPGIQGGQIGPGPRPFGAVCFMSAEIIAFILAVTVAISTVERMFKLTVRPTGQIFIVILAALGLVGMLLLVWGI